MPIMSTPNDPKRATYLMSTTGAGTCSPSHRQSSFSKFIEALRLDEELQDNDDDDDDNAIPPSTFTSTTNNSTHTTTLCGPCDLHSTINIKAPSAKDILRSVHSETVVEIQGTDRRRSFGGKGRHFLSADYLSMFIEKAYDDEEDQGVNDAIKSICSAHVSCPTGGNTISKREASFHEALKDIILAEQASARKKGGNDTKKIPKEPSAKATNDSDLASTIRRRISDEIEWRPKRLSANMA